MATVETSGPAFESPEALFAFIGAQLLDAAPPMVATARAYAPVKTGNLKNHIEARLSRKPDRISLVMDCPGVPYAWRQEHRHKTKSMFMARALYEHADRLRGVAIQAVTDFYGGGGGSLVRVAA